LTSQRSFTKEQREEIEALARELREKLEFTLPQSPDPKRTEEILALRKRLEDMGFEVTYKARLDPQTAEVKVELTLWLPKEKLNQPAN
jgi:hypothetical protein